MGMGKPPELRWPTDTLILLVMHTHGGNQAIYIQGWAKEWSLGLQFFSSCMLRHRLSAGCVATKLNKKSPNLGTTL